MNRIPVVLMCGGNGVWIDGKTERTAKPLVRAGRLTLVEHALQMYARAGATDFVLAAGFQHKQLRALFTGRATADDGTSFTIDEVLGPVRVRVVDTGERTATADRLRQVRPWLAQADTIAVHYCDVLSSVDLSRVLAFHRAHGGLATMVGARMPIRFRILGVRAGETTVRGFATKPVVPSSWINGGYYLFDRAVFDEPWLREGCHLLEDDLLQALAVAGQLEMFPFEGAWQYFDSERHLPRLQAIAEASTQ